MPDADRTLDHSTLNHQTPDQPASPHRPIARWSRQQLDRGVLDSEQHLVWTAPWPAGEPRLRALAETLEREHLRSVELFSFRLLRCRREGSRLTCRLPGGFLAIAFADDATDITPHRVVCRWIIEPGFMSRRLSPEQPASAAAAYGRLVLGVELSPPEHQANQVSDSGGPPLPRIHGWAAVTGFPSRFLTPLPTPLRRVTVLWRAVGRAYALYHALATFSCLRHVARAMHSVAE